MHRRQSSAFEKVERTDAEVWVVVPVLSASPPAFSVVTDNCYCAGPLGPLLLFVYRPWASSTSTVVAQFRQCVLRAVPLRQLPFEKKAEMVFCLELVVSLE